jgi:hypothetical protein
MTTFIVAAAAWLEVVVGVCFIGVPNVPCRLLFAVTPEGIATPLARFAGVALLGLGVACLPSKLAGSCQGAVLGLLAFNIGAAIFCTWVAVATLFRGFLLWPVIMLHAVIASILLAQFLTRGSQAS